MRYHSKKSMQIVADVEYLFFTANFSSLPISSSRVPIIGLIIFKKMALHGSAL